MITIATIFQEMQMDMIQNPMAKINYKIYERKIKRYKPTIDAIMEDFEDNVFGTYSNKRSKESFI